MTDSSFACLSFLEDETSHLFELMIEKAEDTATSLLLDIILQETRKHRELLKHLSLVFEKGASVSSVECEKMGEWFTQALALTRAVKAGVESGMHVPEAARRLIDFEKGVGEEYVTQVHATLRASIQENEAVKTVLESIAEDEKGHAEILQFVIELAARHNI